MTPMLARAKWAIRAITSQWRSASVKSNDLPVSTCWRVSSRVTSSTAAFRTSSSVGDRGITLPRRPWRAPAIAGRLLKLDAEQLANAMALSAAQGNTLSAVRSGQLSNAKAMANAFVAYQGTLCSLLASRGTTGPLSIFEGKGGLDKAFLAGADLNLLMEPIRDRFRISDVSIKAYPCIGTSQAMVAGGDSSAAEYRGSSKRD